MIARALCALFAIPLLAAGPAPQPIEIPFLLPLTGNVAFLGNTIEQTLKAIEKETNAKGGIDHRPVKFTYYDDQASPVIALQVLGSIQKTTPVVFDAGPLATCRVTSAAMKDGPVLYCLSPLFDPPQGSYAFSGSVSLNDMFDAEFQYFRKKNWNRVAVVETTDASGQFTGDVIKRILHLPENKNATLVSEEHYGIGDLSVAAQVQNILAAKPQIILLGANGNAAAAVLHALHDAGSTVPVATSTANMTLQQMETYHDFMPPSPSLLIAAPRWAVPNAVRPGPVKDAINKFLRTLGDAGIKVDGGTSAAYDPALIAIDALKKLGPTATAKQLRDYLSTLQWSGSIGYYDFRQKPQNGLTSKDTVVVCWDNDRKKWIAAP
jgi:branched-chain amino acid transport system substrate-binding protein